MSLEWSKEDKALIRLLLKSTPLLDVRAPVEFAKGSIPGSVNLPLLNDEERAAVGTTYKRRGQEAAIALGHKYLSGETREARMRSWKEFAAAHPEAWVYCFRGGLRSQSVQRALADEGVQLPLLAGGYKRARNVMMNAVEVLSREESFVVVSGHTGSGKTELLESLKPEARVCDLEALAKHRGSAFGSWPRDPQPAQADFENRLAVSLLREQQRASEGLGPILLEDESRMIGRTVLPDLLFSRISTSPVYLVERSRRERAEWLTEQYLRDGFGIEDGALDEGKLEEFYRLAQSSLNAIQKRLGGAELKTLTEMLESAVAEHRRSRKIDVHFNWVERLLASYYDPLYEYHLAKLADRVAMRGSWQEVREALLKLQNL